MSFPSITLALILSASAGAVVAGATMRAGVMPQAKTATPAAERLPADCHRDVRTHRIYGVWIRHRHVGPYCDIREVRQSTVKTPKAKEE